MCCYCSHRAPIQHQDISFKDASLKDPTDTALLCKLFLYDWFPQNTCLPLQPPISIAQSVSPVVELVSEVVRCYNVKEEYVPARVGKHSYALLQGYLARIQDTRMQGLYQDVPASQSQI